MFSLDLLSGRTSSLILVPFQSCFERLAKGQMSCHANFFVFQEGMSARKDYDEADVARYAFSHRSRRQY